MHSNTKKCTKNKFRIQSGGSGAFVCKKFRCDFMSRTFALIAPLQSVLHRVYCLNETFPNLPEHYETLKNMSLGTMGWIGCSRFERLRSDFVARAFALIAPVQPVLHWVYFRNKTIPNAPKHYETHQNMSLWSYGVDWVCLLREILKRLGGTNFCINCNSSAHFALSFVHQRNDPKSTQTLWKRTKAWV